ncbi:unnamed protein product [Pocillopora meandrina]|uniref:Uncharacterized protein n=1 Tax=Pocillopora meandrina TaxID=46732 RepID=A0AAU9VMV3_9CNID|nr:unnamed protein product [Pocillopora meandrina]
MRRVSASSCVQGTNSLTLGVKVFPARAHLAHWQENTNVKGEGGAVGLTENPSALRRWMFEGSNNQTEENDHHEQKSGIQKAFCKDVLNILSSFKNLATRS